MPRLAGLQNAQALRLGGQSLLDAGLCLAASDPREVRGQIQVGARRGLRGLSMGQRTLRVASVGSRSVTCDPLTPTLLQDAAAYFQGALQLDPADAEAAAGLERCAAALAALKEQRRAATAAADAQWQAAQAQQWQQP